jgi:hypothetical protein
MIKVLCPVAVRFDAMLLVQELQQLGHDAIIITKPVPNDSSLHIVYGCRYLKAMPKHYILMQTEIAGTHLFSPEYYRAIKNAVMVWEYQPANLWVYEGLNAKVHLIPPRIAPADSLRVIRLPKDIDVLFYGWLEGSLRRELMLAAIRQQVKVKVVTDITGPAMWRLLARSKVVLNLHYYTDSPLELFRVHEALSHGCHLVSEGPVPPTYTPWVHEGLGASQLAELCKQCAELPPVCNAYVYDALSTRFADLNNCLS